MLAIVVLDSAPSSRSAVPSTAVTSLDPDAVVAALASRGVDSTVPLGFVCEVSRTDGADDMARVLARWLPAMVDADRFELSLPTGVHLRPTGLDRTGAGARPRLVPIDGTTAGRSFADGRIVVSADHRRPAPGEQPTLDDKDLMTSVDLPWRHDDRVAGVVTVARRTAVQFTDAEIAVLQCVCDIAGHQVSLRRRLDEASELALVDPLTGAANRRAFSARGGERLAGRRGRTAQFALGLLDLDRFKQVNDRYGHAIGDEVLKTVVETLHAQSRSGDVVARVGGEEFAMMVSGDLDEAGAVAVFDRIRGAIAAMELTVDGRAVQVTTSIGVTTSTEDDFDVDDLVARADAALYDAKQAGRNRVVFHGPRRH